MKLNIRQLYLYLVSIISLVIIMIGAIQMIDLGIKVYVLKDADRYDFYEMKPALEGGEKLTDEELKQQEEQREKEMVRQRQRTVSNSVSMVVVGGVVFWTHQRMIKKDRKS